MDFGSGSSNGSYMNEVSKVIYQSSIAQQLANWEPKPKAWVLCRSLEQNDTESLGLTKNWKQYLQETSQAKTKPDMSQLGSYPGP